MTPTTKPDRNGNYYLLVTTGLANEARYYRVKASDLDEAYRQADRWRDVQAGTVRRARWIDAGSGESCVPGVAIPFEIESLTSS